ncbi:MAG TPA: YtxH domain-containing protein [Anaerolineae bacterium]|nr:YtxH domain-containing protein [Anaerolineae bacterium]
MSEDRQGLDFVVGFLIGALAGAAAAILMAPKSGEETRGLLRERGIELRDHADQLGAEVRKRAEGVGVQAKERAERLQVQVRQAIDEGRSKAKEDLLARVEPSTPLTDGPED